MQIQAGKMHTDYLKMNSDVYCEKYLFKWFVVECVKCARYNIYLPGVLPLYIYTYNYTPGTYIL